MGHRGGEGGQVLPLVVLIVVCAGLGIAYLGRVGAVAAERARARTAADASALAGAAEGERAARDVAARNGALVIRYRIEGRDVALRVAVGRAEASARARREPDGIGASVDGVHGRARARVSAGMAPAMDAALARAAQLLGRAVPITSGFRTMAEQAALWQRRSTNPYPVARPGSSRHERGLAVDVPATFVSTLLAVAADAGLCHPYPRRDPVHFEVCRRESPP